MELKEIKNKKEADLQKLLAETRNELRILRFKDANKQLKDVRDIRKKKKIVAQILTVLAKLRKAGKQVQVKEDDNQ